jgi:hypothetical protein
VARAERAFFRGSRQARMGARGSPLLFGCSCWWGNILDQLDHLDQTNRNKDLSGLGQVTAVRVILTRAAITPAYLRREPGIALRLKTPPRARDRQGFRLPRSSSQLGANLASIRDALTLVTQCALLDGNRALGAAPCS